MQTEIITTDEQTIIRVTTAPGEVSDDRDKEIAQDSAAYEMAADVANKQGLNPEDGEFEAGTDKNTRESGDGKEWELRFTHDTLSADLEGHLRDAQIKQLDAESEFDAWAEDGYGFVSYVDQVFAKVALDEEMSDWKIYVRGEGDDEGTWSQWS